MTPVRHIRIFKSKEDKQCIKYLKRSMEKLQEV